MQKDKRIHKRYILPKEGQITIFLDSIDGKTNVKAELLNISLGGVGLVMSKEEHQVVAQNTNMRISSIDGTTGLKAMHGVGVEVRWVLEHDAFNNTCFGCQFSDLSKEALSELKNFIKSV